MARVVRFFPRLIGGGLGLLARATDALLTEADQLYLIALLGEDRVALRLVPRRALGLVVASKALTPVGDHFFFFLLYETFFPAFLAAAFACAIPFAVYA